MSGSTLPSNQAFLSKRPGTVCSLILLVIFCVLFASSFRSEQTLFSNDGPLALLAAQSDAPASNFSGYWQHLNWLGNEEPSALLNVTQFLFLSMNWLGADNFGAIIFSKFYALIALMILGLSAWVLLRQLQFHPAICLFGAIAASLNSNALSNACWGLPAWGITRAMMFLALAALISHRDRPSWMKLALAGLAVGMGVMEGYDTGALFSLYVAAFALFLALTGNSSHTAQRWVTGIGRVALIAAFAGLIATQALTTLIGTQVKGVAGAQQDRESRAQRWDFATQWSLPKAEALRVVIPGLFGYRMDTPDGGQYWGAVGRQPGWEQHRQGLVRYSGSGEYAGVLVVLLALWAMGQSFRGERSPYSRFEKQMIWFCGGAALISLLLAFGRHAPFYKFLYALPYFSTIRNPIKFMQPFHVALVILFAFGLQDLARRYWATARTKAATLGGQLKNWWVSADAFQKRWTLGSIAACTVALLGWLLYAASRTQLIAYLQKVGFDATQAASIARFSVAEVGWFWVFLTTSALLVILVLSGFFAGPRAKWAAVLLGLLLVGDLARANSPWIIYYNYKEKYATNPIIEFLRQNPHEQRVAIIPFEINPQFTMLQQFYKVEWLQHHFRYYQIQSLDIPQESRMGEDKQRFLQAIQPHPVRYWQLTNTRYLFGLAGLEQALNQQLDPVRQRFRLHTPFTLTQEAADKPIQVQTNATGPFALIEFTGALPRAALYSDWKSGVPDDAALQQLASPELNPATTVLLAGQLEATPGADANSTTADAVQIVHYSPKHVVLEAKAERPSILLLNDRYHPDWKVRVNGREQRLLRANFIARAVYLEPGEQRVEFRFQPSAGPLYVSLAGVLLGLVFIGFLAFGQANSARHSEAMAIKKPR